MQINATTKDSSLINSKSDRIMCRNKYDSFIPTGKNMI